MTDFPSSPESETLLPCPFCGCSDLVMANTGASWIKCSSCQAEGPPECTDEDATRLWNRRNGLAQSSRDRQAIAAQIREYLQKKYGTYAVQVSSDGVERIYYNGVSLLDLADALSISSPDRGGKA